MTQFDEIFHSAATQADLSWVFVYDDADRNLKVDGEITDYPCILRLFRESVLPLFDAQEGVQRSMSLYIAHTGFEADTSEQINENLEDIIRAFIVWREAMRRAGVEVSINGNPYPSWELADMDVYGYVFDLTVKYSICQS